MIFQIFISVAAKELVALISDIAPNSQSLTHRVPNEAILPLTNSHHCTTRVFFPSSVFRKIEMHRFPSSASLTIYFRMLRNWQFPSAASQRKSRRARRNRGSHPPPRRSPVSEKLLNPEKRIPLPLSLFPFLLPTFPLSTFRPSFLLKTILVFGSK